jgi:hypothetical protein
MSSRINIDRDREHIQVAVDKEGYLLSAADKELLALNERQRSDRLDDLTIRDARLLTSRLLVERKRLASYGSGISDTLEQLRRVVGNGMETD